MRARPTLTLLAVVGVGLGLFSSIALAGRKQAATRISFSGLPTLDSSTRTVTAKGAVHSPGGCEARRVMKLFLTDVNGTTLAELDETTSGTSAHWQLQGIIPSGFPAGNYGIRVKAKRRFAGPYVCNPGLTSNVAIILTG
jgi:hypothetical protein